MNDSLTLDNGLLIELRSRGVMTYLVSEGWILDPGGSSQAAALFHLANYPDAEALVPLDRNFADYAYRMADVVTMISAVEGRPAWAVLNDLAAPPNDILRVRVSADGASLGSLPLEQGIRLYKGMHDLIQATAQGLLKPQALHPQHSLSEVRKFLNECRLGQTERGSFVATLLTPIVPPVIPAAKTLLADEDILDEPFPRRVTLRLMESLDLVAESVRENTLERLMDGVSAGISANLCESLAEMVPPGEQSSLDIGVRWSLSRPVPDQRRFKQITFSRDAFSTIEEAGRMLRKRARAAQQTFIGNVLSVEKVTRTFFDALAKVTIRAEVDGFNARLRFDVKAEHYRQACDALRDDRKVRVSGVIIQDVRAKVYELTQPTGIEVLGVGT